MNILKGVVQGGGETPSCLSRHIISFYDNEDFPCKCMNEPQDEEIFERAFSWFECELPVHACFNNAPFHRNEENRNTKKISYIISPLIVTV